MVRIKIYKFKKYIYKKILKKFEGEHRHTASFVPHQREFIYRSKRWGCLWAVQVRTEVLQARAHPFSQVGPGYSITLDRLVQMVYKGAGRRPKHLPQYLIMLGFTKF